jgi:hypothetical protein
MRKAIITPALAGLIGIGAALAIPAAAMADTGPTSTTMTVNGGLLSISTPDSAGIGALNISSDAILNGTTVVSGSLGNVVVDDERASVSGSWTASVISSDFVTGDASAAETIPATDITYTPGAVVHSAGVGDFTAGQAGTLDNSTPMTAYSAAAEVGVATVTWNPTLAFHLPSAVVAGLYTGTVTHSVA